MIPLVSSWEQCCLLFVLTLHSQLGSIRYHLTSLSFRGQQIRHVRTEIRFLTVVLLFFLSIHISLFFPRAFPILLTDLLKSRVLVSYCPLLICTLCHIASRHHFVIVSFLIFAVDLRPLPNVWFLNATLYNELFRKRDLWMPVPVWSSMVAVSVPLHTTVLCYVRFPLLLRAVCQSCSGLLAHPYKVTWHPINTAWR